MKGAVQTLLRIGFDGPWGVEILSAAHRQRPLREALADVYRTTTALFDEPAIDPDFTGRVQA